MLVTLEVSQLAKASIFVRLEALPNILLILVTLEVSQLAKASIFVRLEALWNI